MFTFTRYCFGDEIDKQAYELGGASRIHEVNHALICLWPV
jgi:hypothetical protein